ncbi:3-hydroxy-3-methylglutaryl-CoA reductase [Brevibacillus laterosporus]|uniref:hydroxymethylglutaryl-CoA reductase n=1 Tax=Brevibacillus laterosporus TaxID=1465 RepID=UPI000BC515BE|nr:hydroxymethylglutaryl-CoA reductase [Brevibacillus laterosporus]PCN46231.1 3-hydroxy-3-methylglutaryl-CoA reductase [Brevibacillus laterosporus]
MKCSTSKKVDNHMLRSVDDNQYQEHFATDDSPLPKRVPGGARVSSKAIESRWELLSVRPEAKEQLLGNQTVEQLELYQKNIENLIGTVSIPVGLAGPLRINGLYAQGDYYIPLATTEAALVASYNRGAQVISQAGGCRTVILKEAIGRTPGFIFESVVEASRFANWAVFEFDTFREVAQSTTNFGQLIRMDHMIEGNYVYLIFEFSTGDASGQNMVTIATQEICNYIRQHSPVPFKNSFVEANFSGDKKASAKSFMTVRGKKVCAEVVLPAKLVRQRFHTTPENMEKYWRMAFVGGVLQGMIGSQGHVANGLAALYLATGQDVACVSESSVGVTRFELTENGDLYASITLPNVIVGTVGGGTGLPSQKACLEIMGLSGAGHVHALAEVCAGLVLAGELSIIAALAADDFTRAHHKLSRGTDGTAQGMVKQYV